MKYLCPECQGYIHWKWANRGYRTCELCVEAAALDKVREVLKQKPELAKLAKELLKEV